MKPKVIPVVGGRKSGKTTAIELLVKDLSQRGYKVAVAKHIPEPDFTIDTEGKDTWRFAQAGAKFIVGLSYDEVATIERIRTAAFSLDDIVKRCNESDIVFLEGFRRLIIADKRFPKIVIAESMEDVEEAVRTFEPILAFVGSCDSEKDYPQIPCVNVVQNPKRLVDAIEVLLKMDEL